MTGHLLLIDSSGIAYRAMNTGPKFVRAWDGAPIGAVVQFLKILWNLLGAAQADPPSHAVATFDHPGLTFRHKLYPKYKANRGPRPAKTSEQFQLMRSAASTLGLMVAEKEGFEADDLIATYSSWATLSGMRTTIVSNDKDFLQIVKDGMVEIIDPMTNKRILDADVVKKFGVSAHLVQEVQALAGDKVDNIPGVKGLSLDGAGSLVADFGVVENVIEAARRCDPSIKKILRPRLISYENQILLNRELTKLLVIDDPSANWRELSATKPIQEADVRALLDKLGAMKLYDYIFGGKPQSVRAAKFDDSLDWWREELIAPGQVIPMEPQAGFYERKLVKNGQWIPARIWFEPVSDPIEASLGHGTLRCEVGGKVEDPAMQWGSLCQHPITETKFRDMMEKIAKLRAETGKLADRALRKPVDILNAKLSPNPQPKRKSK